MVGYCPNYFYLWHSIVRKPILLNQMIILSPAYIFPFSLFPQKAILLLTYRWYAYKKTRDHYFLFDFCYFTNFLIFLYLWLPDWILGPALRGWLFTTCFCFANGPVLVAIMLWKNSLVPHSNDKMTSLFIHISPSLTLFGLRWYIKI